MADFMRRSELEFLLWDLFELGDILQRPAYEHLDDDSVTAVIDTAFRVAADHFAANADFIDANEPTLVEGRVEIDDSVKRSIQAFADAGFISGPFAVDQGGMGLPHLVVSAFMSVFNAANVATAGYGLLTVAAARLLQNYGAPELVDRFFGPMLEGRVLGTMCLSEPDAGSSLGDLRTVARPADDGSYRLRGNKMWISGAGHDMTENILHFVLARIEGAPAGSRGISLFAVPRWLEDDGGRRRNDVHVAGLNHKMGYRGITNCALNFGEEEGAVAWLVGEPHRGLRYMFQMMNEARVEVGMAAVMSAHAAYLYSLEYASERRQGRHPDDRDPSSPPVPIIEHADVRRMLLRQRALTEGAWALVMSCAALLDEAETAETEEEREEAHRLCDLLTPVAKAWPSTWCLQSNELAIQVLGGYGYSREYPVERHYRDNRLNAIHEGTNGIQAMDLLGRKVAGDGGAALRILVRRISEDVERLRDSSELGAFAGALGEAVSRLTAVSMALGGVAAGGDLRAFLANASPYLDLFGHVVVAWQWLRMAERAAAVDDPDFRSGKLAACRFFYDWELPHVDVWAERLEQLDSIALEARPEWF